MGKKSVMEPPSLLDKVVDTGQQVVGNYVGGIVDPVVKRGVRGVPEALAGAADFLPGKKLLLGQGASYSPEAEAARFPVGALPFESARRWAGDHLGPQQVSIRDFIGRMDGDLGYSSPALQALQRAAGGQKMGTGIRMAPTGVDDVIARMPNGVVHVDPMLKHLHPTKQDEKYGEFFGRYFNAP